MRNTNSQDYVRRLKTARYQAIMAQSSATDAEQAELKALRGELFDEAEPMPLTAAGACTPLGSGGRLGTVGRRNFQTATATSNTIQQFRANNPELSGDTGDFGSLGEFLTAVGQQALGKRDERLEALLASRRGSEFTSSAGLGYVIPVGHALTLLESAIIDSELPLFSNCTKVPMTVNSGSFPIFADTTHANSPMDITWQTIPESGEFPEQGVNIESVGLSAHKRGAIFYIGSETISDAGPTFAPSFQNALIRSIGWDIENQLWSSPVGGIRGALGDTGEVTINKESGQAASTIVSKNISKIWSRMLPGHYSRSIWVANEATKPQLAELSISAGTSGQIVGLAGTDRGMVLPPPEQILGRPAFYTECVPTLGTEGDINLLDPTMYVLGMVLNPVVEADRSFRFNKDQVSFRVKYRAAGTPLLRTTFAPKKGETRGWLVNVQTR